MSAVYGYISSMLSRQAVEHEIVSLERAGASVVYSESSFEEFNLRPALADLISDCTSDDLVIVMHLNRLGSKTDLIIETVSSILSAGAHLISLGDGLDTRKDKGIGMAFAALNSARDQLIGKGEPGLAEASARSRRPVGRPSVSSARLQYALSLVARGGSFSEAASRVGCSVSTIHRFHAAAKQS
ncbi:recombinase family protein [Sphingomonas sp. DT-51]|uniref:recombinase family protein n=1 Tax=Sphingomonas sp. DT-51 TaxID=3396165 RepID=UPI003F1D98D3